MKLTLAVLAFAALAQGADWKLVWSDEFDKPGQPDPSRWTYEEGHLRNEEAQYYTRRIENARIENGILILEARRESVHQDFDYTSASITTEGHAAWRYGRMEVRAKLPKARGTWPAIWMLGANHRSADWPKCGEIDILESVGFNPGRIHANIHTQTYNHAIHTGKGSSTMVEDLYGGFHIYALEWFPDHMDFFVDGHKYFTYANENTGSDTWPFDQPFFLILNLAIGGTWGGEKGIDAAAFPQRMEVDYVRVFERQP